MAPVQAVHRADILRVTLAVWQSTTGKPVGVVFDCNDRAAGGHLVADAAGGRPTLAVSLRSQPASRIPWLAGQTPGFWQDARRRVGSSTYLHTHG